MIYSTNISKTKNDDIHIVLHKTCNNTYYGYKLINFADVKKRKQYRYINRRIRGEIIY